MRLTNGRRAAAGRRAIMAVAGLLGCGLMSQATAQFTLTEGTNISADVSAADGRLAMDLLGSIWLLPSHGGQADRIINNLQPATDPRWSPDSRSILYQARSGPGSQIRVYDLAAGSSTPATDGRYYDRDASWHPDGRRIVFSSQRHDRGFDLWETHLPTGLRWRLTHHRGDEISPAWSADGRDLAYIRALDDEWRLVLRRHGRAEQELVVSTEPLAALSWRPDGSLLTFLRKRDDAYSLDIVILSDPPVVRSIAAGEDFFLSPVSWFDRQLFFYSADGTIKERRFNDWRSKPLMFRANVGQPAARPIGTPAARRIEIENPSTQRLVIRTRRLFDGDTPGYRENLDVVIAAGRIEAVKPRATYDDATVLDLGDATLLPGFIDLYAGLPADDQAEVGLRLLSFGVTTVVADRLPQSFNPERWDSLQTPGPRLLQARAIDTVDAGDPAATGSLPILLILPATGSAGAAADNPVTAWQARGVPVLAESASAGLLVGADLLLGAEHLPASPRGRRYADLAMAAGRGPTTLVSGLADAATPGLAQLFASRQAALTPAAAGSIRPYAERADLTAATTTVVVGSKPNGLPAGMALHAELRALAAAGLDGERVLKAAGANAAAALGLQQELGRIVPGAVADLVIVAGDPRQQVADALNIVAVIRSGHFYSLVRLLEQAGKRPAVE